MNERPASFVNLAHFLAYSEFRKPKECCWAADDTFVLTWVSATKIEFR